MDIQKTMQNLEKNGIKPYFVENKDEVVPLVKTLINNGESVSQPNVLIYDCLSSSPCKPVRSIKS